MKCQSPWVPPRALSIFLQSKKHDASAGLSKDCFALNSIASDRFHSYN